MSPRYSNVTANIRGFDHMMCITQFQIHLLNPTKRTSKSAPRFLPEKKGWKHASTPMHRLPQCHLGNLQVECQNIHQVDQYDTPLSPRVFIRKTYIMCSQNLNIQSDNNKTSKGKDSIHHNKDGEGRNIIWSIYINKAHDTSRSWHLKITREREIKHIATSTYP